MIDLERLTLAELTHKAAAQFKDRLAFATYREGHICNRITYREWGIRTRQFGGLLRTLGLHTGDRVLILAENRPEWPIAYFGAAQGGFVSVPVLPDCSSEQIKAIGDHAGIAALCITEKTGPKLTLAGFDPVIPLIYIDTSNEPGGTPASILVSIHGRKKSLPLWQEGLEREPTSWFPEIQEDDLASILYTPGVTGHSKGVMRSHRNVLFMAQAGCALMHSFPRDRLLSVTPLAHPYECTLGLLAAVMSGASITYLDQPSTPAAVLSAVQDLRPTIMVTVPSFIENLYRRRIAPALKGHPLYQFPLTRFLAIKIAGYKLIAALGSSIRFFGIGGALSHEVETFLRKVQFPYAPAYGLTETASLIAGTEPYRFPFGSVGKPLKGVEFRLFSLTGKKILGGPGTLVEYIEGEIQVHGPPVMLGYYRDPEGTRGAFTADGWFRTGEVGFLDPTGHLFIRGRLKALIRGPSGERSYPEEVLLPQP
ncbi:MAG: AMP-binding protein [Treponema sp.]|nr:AMP-binding protein [Treponema sp.]